MVWPKDLVEKGTLIGKTRPAIVSMLGAPHSSWGTDGLKWSLGKRDSGAAMMFPYEEYLVVEFDSKALAVSSKLVSLE